MDILKKKELTCYYTILKFLVWKIDIVT